MKKLLLYIALFSASPLYSQAQRVVDENSLVTANDIGRVTARYPFYFAEFLSAATTANAPFVGASVSSGTSAANQTNQLANRPGVIRLTSSTTANGGYRWVTDASPWLIKGNEYFECAIAPVNFSTTTFRAGLLDNSTSADVTDGIYFEYSTNGAIVLKTASNGTRSTSAAITTLSLNTWYKLVIVVNANATNCSGFVYNGSNGALIGSATISTNIPTSAGRWTGAGIIATESTTTATAMLDLDYLLFTTILAR